MSRLSIVIFGATGFTGKYAVLDMVRIAKLHPGLTWGVAGRSQSKLESLMQDVAAKTGENLSNIPIIIADVSNEKSLKEMCERAKVIANCCGPYRLYGEPVVRAAIAAGTHQVDITGEPQFIETMQLKYSEQARAAGVYIINACGYDSIPNDMGVIFLQQQFKGTVNVIQSYMSSVIPEKYRAQAAREGVIHYGTWESLVLGLAHYDELKPLRQKLYPERLPTFLPKLRKPWVIHKGIDGWCLPFMGADNSIVYRTQRTLYESTGRRPAQFKAYLDVGSWLYAFLGLVAAAVIYLLTRSSFLRRILLNHPRICTFGMVTRQGPSEDVMNNTKYTVTLMAEGWTPGTEDKRGPNKWMQAQVSGMNPGYGATVSALLYSAITILEEKDKMPSDGGVYTTGCAFKDTSLVARLSEPGNNMKFEIVAFTTN